MTRKELGDNRYSVKDSLDVFVTSKSEQLTPNPCGCTDPVKQRLTPRAQDEKIKPRSFSYAKVKTDGQTLVTDVCRSH